MAATVDKVDAAVGYHNEEVDMEERKVGLAREEPDPAVVRAITRKIDMRLLPVLTVLYLFSFMDRSNIGNARVAGLDRTLNLTDAQYNMCLTIFFFPYALFEVPSNIMLKLLRPSLWVAIIVLTWGTVMTLMGLVQGYGGLLAGRFFLGLAEAGLFPAATYILTLFYCRFEIQTRVSIFFSAASLAGAFSGLLAYAIQQMNGIAGLEGWRWIFIIEGIATVAIGMSIPWLLMDSPETASFLTEEEKSILIQRLRDDYSNGVVEKGRFQWKYLRQALTDWKIYLGVVIFWGNTIPGYSFGFTLPTVLRGLGYSANNAQLMTIPIYIVGCITTLLVGYYADKRRTRSSFLIGTFSTTAIGFIMVMALPKTKWPGARYGALFIVSAGLYPCLGGTVAWNSNNLAGSWKRNIGIALQITFGNLGGAVGSNIFLKRQAPVYWIGYGVSLATIVLAISACVVLRIALRYVNRQRDKLSSEEIYQRYTTEQLTEMGDRSPLYRYVT